MCKYVLFPVMLCTSNAVLFLLPLVLIMDDNDFYNIKTYFQPIIEFIFVSSPCLGAKSNCLIMFYWLLL